MKPEIYRCVLCCLAIVWLADKVGAPQAEERLRQEQAITPNEDPWEDVTEVPEPQNLQKALDDAPLNHANSKGLEADPAKQDGRSLAWKGLRVRRFWRANKIIANAWASEFCKPDGVFDRNFALIGTGEGRSALLRQSGSEFKLYCTGRRFSKYLEATLKLKSRQDLFSLLIGLVYPLEDQLDIEVFMKESNMPHMVLAIATKKLMKAMLKEESGEDDVRKLARKIEVAKDKLPAWPSDKLVVYAEHSSLFYDIVHPNLVEQVFSHTALPLHGRLFRMLHFTSEQSYGPEDQRAVLRFSFAIPSIEKMPDMAKLLSAVAAFIDLLGNYQLSPEMKKRAEKVRHDVSRKEAKEKGRDKDDLIEGRRLAKRAEEMERLKRMTPEQREKYEARKAKIENGRAQKRFVRRA